MSATSAAAILQAPALPPGPPFVERVRVRLRRQVLWARHLRSSGAELHDRAHPAIERLFEDAAELALAEERFHASHESSRRLSATIEYADAATDADPDWSNLRQCFQLGRPELDLLSLALAVEIDPSLRGAYAYLHDDASAVHATQWLASRVFGWPASYHCSLDSNLVSWWLARPLGNSSHAFGPMAPWIADPTIVQLTERRRFYDGVLGASVTLERGDAVARLTCAHPRVLESMQSFVGAMRASAGQALELELVGATGAGKRTLACQLAASLGHDLLIADAEALLSGQASDAVQERVVRVVRMARAAGAFLYWHGAEALPSAAWQAWRGVCDLTIFGSEQAALGRTDGVVRHSFRLGTLRRAEREAIWKHVSNEPAPSMVQDRLLSVGEIALVARAAPGGHAAMQQACRGFLEPFSDILQPVACPFSWDDLVLAPDVRRQLEEFEQQARLRWPVYEEWGFERLCPSSKGIAAMFAGPSGTGKTMAAQVIARSIGLELYRVDLSGVMNKYIGETEKRLRQVFDHCERASVVLFFDEADALFGQRTQTKDAHDRFANIQVDYLLQRMEQYDGIAILATNRKNDVDKAFLRRLRFSIDFLAPGPEERLALWQRALLPESPSGEPLLDAIDWRFLAEKLALSGADIKTAALGAAFLARAEETRIGMRHVLAAAKREMLKQGAVLRTNS